MSLQKEVDDLRDYVQAQFEHFIKIADSNGDFQNQMGKAIELLTSTNEKIIEKNIELTTIVANLSTHLERNQEEIKIIKEKLGLD